MKDFITVMDQVSLLMSQKRFDDDKVEIDTHLLVQEGQDQTLQLHIDILFDPSLQAGTLR